MAIDDHLQIFAGKRVVDWDSNTGVEDPEQTIYRLSISYDYGQTQSIDWADYFASFLADPRAHEVNGLVIGVWDNQGGNEDIESVVETLVAAQEQLSRLTALFIGDITYEENEISWIQQGDLSPILAAYPKLEYFGARGGNNLQLGISHHEHLRSLIVESGGLPSNVVQDVLSSHLPALEHLELWLGTENYGASTRIEDLAPLFTGQLFPHLRYLGLRDSDLSDEIAQEIAKSPLLERIEVLDLSLGILSDKGARALLESPATRSLKKLDIHHHYCTDEVVKQLQELGIAVDASEQEEADDEGYRFEGRYVAVGE